MLHVQQFGRYDIVRKLSRSMTDVYLARDREADRDVALKLIEHSRDDYTQLVMEAERRGAQLQSQLHRLDPRILEIYDYGEQNGYLFVAMQYFPGQTLAELLRTERRLHPRRAVRYAAEICSQLQSLHSFVSDVNGHRTAVIHGDIKPSNIQIGANDELRLLDFGIAKMITFTHNLTHHNLGSPSYCSPERIAKAQVDAQADLWAVGVSLYEMVAGSPPYQAQNTRKLENLIQSRRAPRALPENCPPALKAIIAKALAADIDQRYASAQSFGEDLRAFLEGRRTAAEQQHVRAWEANETIERPLPANTGRQTVARPAPVAKPTTARRKLPKNFASISIALLAGVLAGLLIFIPISSYSQFEDTSARLRARRDYANESRQSIASDWSLYQGLKKQYKFLGNYSLAKSIDAPLHANLLNAAENIIDNFRQSSDARPADVDWEKARTCLRHALEIEPNDSKAKGELTLCDAYLDVIEGSADAYTRAAAGFRQAESFLPKWPDPHLGLARVYVYGFHNIGQARAELHKAEQLGYHLGEREAEEQGDGYFQRAQAELARAKRTPDTAKAERDRWLQAARVDTERARVLYEPIAGYSNVDSELEQLYAARDEEARLEAVDKPPAPAKKPAAKKQHWWSLRRWQ